MWTRAKRRLIDELWRDRWSVGMVSMSIADIIRRGSMPEPVWIAGPPRDRFYADPFLLTADGDRRVILVEELVFGSQGRLTRLELDTRGAILDARAVFAPDHHLSYPFLLRQGDATYCIPESYQTRRVSAFRVGGAGTELSFERDLLDGIAACDSTLVEHGGRWWLFCTVAGDNATLYLYSAPHWHGPYSPHARNPVKRDESAGRPAGAFISIDGALYRPAQDCVARYGAAVVINRVLQLDDEDYREEPVLRIGPSKAWPEGLHTLNGLGEVTVVDGVVADPPWRWIGR